jgi:very-short-patch-repair endonuclease
VDGLFTRAQARARGYSAYQVRRRIETGEWRVVLGSVLAERGTRITPHLRDRAAARAVPGSVLAGASAARLLANPVPDRIACLWVGPLRPGALPAVRYLRDPLRVRDIMTGEGVRHTAPDRTVFDCLRFLDDPAALTLLDRALQAGWITEAELTARVRDFVGRRGAPRLARLARLACSGARSTAERKAIALLRAARIEGWIANQPIRDSSGLIGVGDLVFEAARLVVEIDGRAYHSAPERFERDRERQNRLVRAGWTVLRFTWRDLTARPAYVVGTIRAMLTAGPPR